MFVVTQNVQTITLYNEGMTKDMKKIPRCRKTVSGNHTFTKKFLLGASVAFKQELYGPETCIFCGMVNDSGESLIGGSHG